MTLTLGSQSFQSAGLPWLIVLAMMFLGFASRGRQRLTFQLAGIAVPVLRLRKRRHHSHSASN
jgi:hypothetical protein